MSIPNFHPVWYDAPRALYADFVTRSLAANDETKMAALGGIAGSENRLTTFFKRTKTLLSEAEQCIYVFSSAGQTWEPVFILRGRRGERASELISRDRDLEKANFHGNMGELSTHLTRLRCLCTPSCICGPAHLLCAHSNNQPYSQYRLEVYLSSSPSQ